MTAQPGRDFLLQIYQGSSYQTVGGMRTTAMSINNQLIDISHKNSGSWRALLGEAGIRSLSVTAAGIFEDSTAEESVRVAAFSGGLLQSKLLFGNGSSITAMMGISRYDRAGDYNGEETYSITLESAGEVTYAAS